MDRIVFALSLILFINLDASAGLISRYFNKVPLSEAHTITGTSSERELPESVKVLVWNIKKTQEAAWEKEFKTFSQGRELFLLQEAYPNELFTKTLESFPEFRWDMGISFRYQLFGNLPTGTMIGSRVEPTELVIKHTVDREPATDTPKAMTLGKYPLKGSSKELLVINVHGINFTTFGSFKRNMFQAEEEISKHEGPVLVAGDFNTRTKARMRYLFDLMQKHKLTEVKFKNAHQRMVAKFTNNVLDHGFVRGLDVKNAEVLGFARGSDHKPMVLDITVQEEN
ncbi:endonuclease/exonuclease/phosphatase family protein [Peredibacter starrii]|uniref:Endonuclease/exonuclease/phosphatase family protein n=1 Tax=Peredibacter starrii TaxID=28202 RepID=A0AAX4HU55_9BACT|nr:endonuclease/exonuclease/phosphatase family protein [Peredibacter starrii]WPU66746.1 endonuclease/exonuclease/phosphatase family protein [Peredibacter starrii]